MAYTISHHTPLTRLLAFLGRPLHIGRHRQRFDSQPDSITCPSERPHANPDYPDWLGYTPDIQRLLR